MKGEGTASVTRRQIAFILGGSGLLILGAFVAARLSSTPARTDFFENVHWTIAYVMGAILGWMGVRRADPQDRNARRWFAYGLTASALGQIAWNVQSATGWNPYPAPSDALFLCLGPCCAYGMVCTVRDQLRRPLSWAFILDVTMLAIVVLAITIAIYLPRTQSTGIGAATLVAYPISMLLAPCFAAVMAPTLKLIPLRQSMTLLAALLMNAAMWMQWLYFAQEETLANNTWLYLLFSGVSLLIGLGAFTWKVESSYDPAWERRCEGALRMLPLLAVSGAAISVGLAWWLPGVSHTVTIAIYVSAAVTLALAFARQSLLLLERDRLISAERHAREIERQFQTLFRNSRDGLAFLDASGHFIEVNPACAQFFGFDRSELLRMNVADMTGGARARIESYVAFTRTQGGGLLEVEFRGKEGRLLDIEISSVLLPGSRGELFMAFRDVSERKKSDEARTRLEAQLRQSQKLEAIGTLASGIAHDFNNILSAILGNVELALHDTDAVSPALTSLNEIRKAGQRAKELIRRIVAFARPQEANARPQQLAFVVEEAMQLVRVTLPATVNITRDLQTHAPPVMVDSSQISQVLFNLCTNAYQAMQHHVGRIDISLDVRDINEEMARHNVDLHAGQYVCLHVSDTGSGIDPQIAHRIFEPFFTTKPSGEGSGLGLSMVHGIVRAHGGAITVDSQPGNGTTFHIYLPAATGGEWVGPEIAPAIAERGSGSNQHILYVDDEESLVFLTQRLLERRGYRVSGFTDADAALDAFLAGDSQFDLVITDKSMPGRSGTDLAFEMLQAHPATRIVLVSGYLRPEEIEQAKAIGIQEVILKPATVDELAATVHRLLSQHREPGDVKPESSAGALT